MADIAAVFHWPLSELAAMDFFDLLDWHARALDRWKALMKLRAAP